MPDRDTSVPGQCLKSSSGKFQVCLTRPRLKCELTHANTGFWARARFREGPLRGGRPILQAGNPVQLVTARPQSQLLGPHAKKDPWCPVGKERLGPAPVLRARETCRAPSGLRSAFFESSTQPGTRQVPSKRDTHICTLARTLRSPRKSPPRGQPLPVQ